MKKTSIGGRTARIQVFSILVTGSLALGAIAPAALSETKSKRKKALAPFALIGGTVFRDSGLALRGAEVTVTASPEAKPAAKVKAMKALSDGRGEFAFRVPPVPMRYTVSVKAEGFRAQQRTVSVQDEERVDVFFQLDAAPK